MSTGIDIVSLIGVCIELTKFIIEIGQATKDAHGLPKDLATLFEEFPAVQDLFMRAAKTNDGLTDEKRKLAEPILENCKKALNQLASLFEKICPRDSDNHLKRCWKGTKSAVFGRNSELEKNWKKVQDCLGLLEKQQILEVGDKLDELNTAVASLAQVQDEGSKYAHYGDGSQQIAEAGGTFYTQGGGKHNNYTQSFGHTIFYTAAQPKNTDEECLRSLAFDQMEIRDDIDEKTSGTCTWILNHPQYVPWIRKGGLLWIKGRPGTGKSTIMGALLSHEKALSKVPAASESGLKTSPDHVIVSFFFHRRGGALQHTKLGLFRSLLNQILRQDPRLLSEFCQDTDYKKKCENEGIPSRDWHWRESDLRKHLTKFLQKLSSKRRIRLYIDALDETGDIVADDLMRYLEHILELCTPNVSICVSCRPWPDVVRKYDFRITIEEENENDIRTYLRSRFSSAMVGIEATELIDVEQQIATRASGVFQWVVQVTNIVIRLRREGKDHILKEIQKLPQQLGKLYQSMFEHLREPDNATDRALTLSIMRWITFAAEPLTVEQLRVAVAINWNITTNITQDPSHSIHWCADYERMLARILRLSQDLIKVTSDQRLQFDHESVQDYMLGDGIIFFEEICGSISVGNLVGRSHHVLSMSCFRYMKDFVRSGSTVNNVGIIRGGITGFPFYVESYFAHHAMAADRNGYTQEGLITMTEWPSNEIWSMTEWQIWGMTEWHDELSSQKGVRALRHGMTFFTLQHFAAFFGLYGVIFELALMCRERSKTSGRNFKLSHQGFDGLDTRDEFGRTPLFYAIIRGNEKLVRLLIETGQIPLDLKKASERPHAANIYPCSDWLMSNLLDWQEKITPLHLAASSGFTDVVQTLLTAKANVNAVDYEGKTPLHHAAKEGQIEAVDALLHANAKMDAVDHQGMTALDSLEKHVVSVPKEDAELLGRYKQVHRRLKLLECRRRDYGKRKMSLMLAIEEKNLELRELFEQKTVLERRRASLRQRHEQENHRGRPGWTSQLGFGIVTSTLLEYVTDGILPREDRIDLDVELLELQEKISRIDRKMEAGIAEREKLRNIVEGSRDVQAEHARH